MEDKDRLDAATGDLASAHNGDDFDTGDEPDRGGIRGGSVASTLAATQTQPHPTAPTVPTRSQPQPATREALVAEIARLTTQLSQYGDGAKEVQEGEGNGGGR